MNRRRLLADQGFDSLPDDRDIVEVEGPDDVCKKEVFFREDSTSVSCSPGRAIRRGMPGKPPPLPISMRRPSGLSIQGAGVSESTK